MKKKSVKPKVLKKPKKMITRIWDDVYGREIWLALGYSGKDFCDLAKKKFNLKGDFPITSAEGSVHTLADDDDGGRLTFVLRLCDFKFDVSHNGLLIHELHHLTHGILEDTGMPYDSKNSEAHAYLIQSLFTKMSSHLHRYARQHEKCTQKSTNRKSSKG